MEIVNAPEHALANIVSHLAGQPCWNVIAGSGTGSLISLSFGGKRPLKKILSNENLTRERRHTDGEYELYVACAWRLETDREVICTSTSSNGANDTMIVALNGIVGQSVETAAVCFPGGDIRLRFSHGVSLAIFADQANELDESCNYVLSDNDLVVANEARSCLNLSVRQARGSATSDRSAPPLSIVRKPV